MKKLSYDEITAFISSKVTDIPIAYYFDFNNAVGNDYISQELADEIINFVHNHPYFSKSNFDIEINGASSFTKEIADLICDVIVANFYEELLAPYSAYENRFSTGSITEWFYSIVQQSLWLSECHSREYCGITFVTLNVSPISEEGILEELGGMRSPYLDESDWNYLYLVDDYQSEKVKAKVAKIVNKYIKKVS